LYFFIVYVNIVGVFYTGLNSSFDFVDFNLKGTLVVRFPVFDGAVIRNSAQSGENFLATRPERVDALINTWTPAMTDSRTDAIITVFPEGSSACFFREIDSISMGQSSGATASGSLSATGTTSNLAATIVDEEKIDHNSYGNLSSRELGSLISFDWWPDRTATVTATIRNQTPVICDFNSDILQFASSDTVADLYDTYFSGLYHGIRVLLHLLNGWSPSNNIFASAFCGSSYWKFGMCYKYRKLYSKVGRGSCRKVGKRRVNTRGPLIKFDILFGKEFSSDNSGDGPVSDASSSIPDDSSSDSDFTSSSSSVSSKSSFCSPCTAVPPGKKAATSPVKSSADAQQTPLASKSLLIRRKSHQVSWKRLNKEQRVMWANEIMSKKCGCSKEYCLLDTEDIGKASIIIDARDIFMSFSSTEFYSAIEAYFDSANVFDTKTGSLKPNSMYRIGND